MKVNRSRLLGSLFVVAVLETTTTFGVQPPTEEQQTEKNAKGREPARVDFDHAKVNESRSYMRTVAPGEIIVVTITNTCVEKFNYDLRKISAGTSEEAAEECTPTKALEIVHEEKYGGYIIDIQRSVADPVTIEVDGKEVTLNDLEIVISVQPKKWDYELAGAFTTSWLTDPAFGLEMRVPEGSADGVERAFVIRDREAEDEVRLGVGVFAHVFHTSFPHLAGTFGLGINESNQTTYFTGISWRFGEAAALTIGYSWGSVKRLPSGTRFDRPVDAGILGNLGSRTDGDVFFGLSYKFLNPSSALEKPFQEVKDKKAGDAEKK